jgi:hypothetical protein
VTITDTYERIIHDPKNQGWLESKDLVEFLTAVSDLMMALPNMVRLSGEVLYVGDVHGDIGSMMKAFHISDERQSHIIFLGDVVDRGNHQIECVNLLLARRHLAPERIHYIRGNHEFKEVNARWGFADAVMERYPETVYWLYNTVFTTLPLASLQNDRVMGVHGGVCKYVPTLKSIESLNRPSLSVYDERLGLLWNDPTEEMNGYDVNTTRGVFFNFGRNVFDEFMDRNDLYLMVRGHTVQNEGVRYYFNGRLISVFSSADSYKNTHPKAVLVRASGEVKELAL